MEYSFFFFIIFSSAMACRSVALASDRKVPRFDPALGAKRKQFLSAPLPMVNWVLMAWHEGNMDAANGDSVFKSDHLVEGLIPPSPTD